MKKLFVIVLVPVFLAGCASGLGGADYERHEARRIQEVKIGVVESVRSVKLEGTDSAVGTVAGGIVGSGKGSAQYDHQRAEVRSDPHSFQFKIDCQEKYRNGQKD